MDDEFQDRLLNDEMADLLHESMKILGIYMVAFKSSFKSKLRNSRNKSIFIEIMI